MKKRDVKMCTGSNNQLMLNSAFVWHNTVTTATVHSTIITHTHTYAGETCLPTGDLEDHSNPVENDSEMSPSNREVIVQDNINEDGSLQHKDAEEKQQKKTL